MTAKVAELFSRQGEWTESEYFALPETNRYLELSEGRLIMPPHPTNTHQSAVGRLYRWLDEFVQERNLGIVRLAPLRLAWEHNHDRISGSATSAACDWRRCDWRGNITTIVSPGAQPRQRATGAAAGASVGW
jgi:hypothetical protein